MIEELTGGTRRHYCVSKTYSQDTYASGSGQYLQSRLSKFPCDIDVGHTADRENFSFGEGLGNPRDTAAGWCAGHSATNKEGNDDEEF